MRPGTSSDARSSAPRPGGSTCRIEGIALGPFETNCYIVYDGAAAAKPAPCWIIDASFEPESLIARVKQLGLAPAALVLTHAHVDHIAGVDEVRRAFPGLAVVGHAAEREWLSNPVLNLSSPIGLDVTAHGPDRFLAEGDVLDMAGDQWRVLHTPGHSPGSVSLFNERGHAAIVGDTLFAGSIGRTDFPGCDFETLAASIRTKLYTLPDDTTIYPGHGPESTIAHEKRTNPFVRP